MPYKADGEAGIGRQLVGHDINKDGLPDLDLAAGGMKGGPTSLMHRRETVDQGRGGKNAAQSTEPSGTPRQPRSVAPPATVKGDASMSRTVLMALAAIGMAASSAGGATAAIERAGHADRRGGGARVVPERPPHPD